MTRHSVGLGAPPVMALACSAALGLTEFLDATSGPQPQHPDHEIWDMGANCHLKDLFRETMCKRWRIWRFQLAQSYTFVLAGDRTLVSVEMLV